jgi:hypothetical protein
MEPRQFLEPEAANPQPATPSPPQTTCATNRYADLGSGSRLHLFNPADKPSALSGAAPMRTGGRADWAGIAARMINEDVKYHADV